MRKMLKAWGPAPITSSDIEIAKSGLRRALEREAKHSPRIPLICTLAIDWQNEDRNKVMQLARFDISFFDGEFFNGPGPDKKDETAPLTAIEGYRIDRLILSGLFRGFHGSEVDYLRGITPEHSRDVAQNKIQSSNYSRSHASLALWPGCGALLFFLLMNTERLDCVGDIVVNTRNSLSWHYKPFGDCRQNDEKWLEQHNYEWDMKPQR